MAFYLQRSDTFVPTSYCIGPWDPTMQHGGPPAALLAGAAERFGDDASSFVVTRVALELLRPIGLVPLRVEVSPLRLGRQAQWLEVELFNEKKRMARATVVRIAREKLTLPDRSRPTPSPAFAPDTPEFVFPFFQTDEGYHRGVEIRIAEGKWGDGPCTAWMRPRYRLVDGVVSSPLEEVMLMADATNGLAPALDVRNFAFINPDLTVHLSRPFEGPWLALSARAVAEPIGTGLVQSQLFDHQGELGRSLQSLVVRARTPRG